MTVQGMGTAAWVRALDNLELLAAPVAEELKRLSARAPELAEQAVVEDSCVGGGRGADRPVIGPRGKTCLSSHRRNSPSSAGMG